MIILIRQYRKIAMLTLSAFVFTELQNNVLGTKLPWEAMTCFQNKSQNPTTDSTDKIKQNDV